MSNLTSVKEQDFLDEDPPLRAQNYVCLSFLSPEDVIKKKEVYFFEKFLGAFSKDITEFFTQFSEKYKDEADSIKMIQERYSYLFKPENLQEEYSFFIQNRSDLEKEYYENNDFQTSIRGIKVRGVFDTLREAEIRAQVLKKLDSKFNVYVAQVGCWCPWSPNPDDISNQEYAETHLNSLMKNYKDNQDKKDYFYEERKKELQFIKVKEQMDKKDPWIDNKENQPQNEIVESAEVVPDLAPAPVVVDVAPVVADVAPVVADVAPVVADVAPVVADVAPEVVADVAPVVADVAPEVVADVAPVVADVAPEVVADVAPVVADVAPVVADSVSV
jgi:hypothetical protein